MQITKVSASSKNVRLFSALALCMTGALATGAAANPGKSSPNSTAQTGAASEPSAQAAQPLPDRDVIFSPALPDRAQQAIVDILGDEALAGADLSLMVYDVAADEVLVDSDSALPVNPASNAKLITAAAALDILSPQYRWKTEYYVTGTNKNGQLHGNLVVKGYGDPTVVNERLQRVADELYLAGVRRIRGRIVVDASHFDNDTDAQGWDQEDKPDRAYAAPVSGLSFNYNAIGINIRPEGEGEPAVVELNPPVSMAHIDGEVMTGRYVRRLRVETERDKKRGGTLVNLDGEVGVRDAPRRIYRRIWDAPRYFGAALATFLKRRGVSVSDRVVKGPVPEGARLLHVDHSPPLTEVMSVLNHYSNNFIAETVVKTIGAESTGRQGTFRDGLARVSRFLEEKVGFPKGTYVYGNGSGLNDVNRFTARHVVSLLDYMRGRPDLAADYQSSLAVAGKRGTIRNRMKNSAAAERLRAKTGTLTGVSALSGYVSDPQNRLLAFSILVQGYPRDVRVSRIWHIQNQIGEAIASDGESWTAPEVETPDTPPGAATPVAMAPRAARANAPLAWKMTARP